MGGFGAFQLGGFAPDAFDVVISVAGYGLGTLEPERCPVAASSQNLLRAQKPTTENWKRKKGKVGKGNRKEWEEGKRKEKEEGIRKRKRKEREGSIWKYLLFMCHTKFIQIPFLFREIAYPRCFASQKKCTTHRSRWAAESFRTAESPSWESWQPKVGLGQFPNIGDIKPLILGWPK